MEVKEDLTLKTRPVKIMDRSEKILRNKRVSLVRVLWRTLKLRKKRGRENQRLRKNTPSNSLSQVCSLNFRDEIFIKREECEA
jgi:hypothetical protein